MTTTVVQPDDSPYSESESSSEAETDFGSGDTEDVPTFTITDSGGSWSDQSNLNIFNNDTYGSTTIAPGVSGTYTFNLSNNSEDDLFFTISLSEENEYGIAMMYMLVRDGAFLTNGYVRVAEFELAEQTLKAGETTSFTLYWYWDPNVDDEADTKAGQNQMVYSLTITIDSYFADPDDEPIEQLVICLKP